MTDTGRRRWAIAVFAVLVAAELAYLRTVAGVGASPVLASPLVVDRGEVIGSLATGALGFVLCWLRPRNPVGWLVSLCGLLLILCDLGQAYGERAAALPHEHLPLGALAMQLSAPLWIPVLFVPVSVLLVRYPTGEVDGRWGRRFDRAAWTGFLLVWVAYAGSANAVTDEVPAGHRAVALPDAASAVLGALGGVLLLGGTLAILGHTVVRLRRSDARERAALLLLLVAATAAAVFIFATNTGPLAMTAYGSILVAIAVGVLRYNALGIEVVVRRTLLYALLTALVLLAFVGISAGLARLLPTGPTPQIVAAALIAVGLAPARERLQGLVDRLLYGREDPAVTLRRLGDSMGATPSEGLLVAVTANLTEALRVDGVEVVAADGTPVASWGHPDRIVSLPLTFAGQDLGELRVGTRRGEPLGRADRALLETVTPLIAAVVHAVRLAEDLRAERNRVVAATERERSRLRQELHDGLGPSLTGIGLGLEAAQSSGLPPRALELVTRLRDEVTAALEETRRIIDDLRPAPLDDGDLVAALRHRVDTAAAAGLAVSLRVEGALPLLPPDVEAAAFRIVEEALTNVVRHAQASTCTVTVRADGELRVTVDDDGVGLTGTELRPRRGGVGLWSMRDRAARLGGTLEVRPLTRGTRIGLVLPLTAPLAPVERTTP